MQRRETGFSLVELLAVLAMIGLTVALGAYVVRTSSWRVSAAASTAARQFELARSRAAFENHDVRVTIDAATAELSIHSDLNSDGTVETSIGETVTRVPLRQSGRDVVIAYPTGVHGLAGTELASAVTFPGSPPTIVFRPTGAATSGALYLVPSDDLARSCATNMRAVTVDAASGRIRTWRYNADPAASPPWRLAR